MGKVLELLRSRKDTEHEQAFLRLIVSLVGIVYLLFWADKLPPPPISTLPPFLYYCMPAFGGIITSMLGFVLIIRNPEPSPIRRIAFIVSDNALITWQIYMPGYIGAPWIFMYVWLILGNAFRYGTPYLIACSAASIAGFTALNYISHYWQSQPILQWTILMILIVIPLYVYPLLSRLQRAQQRAESANAAKTRFLANVNHELRTPLNAIIGNAHLLIEDCALNRQQKRKIGDILSAARHQLGIINNVIDMSKIESDAIERQDVPIALYKEILALVRLLQVHANEKGLNLTVSIDPLTPPFMVIDRQKFVQILTNLVGNAIKFTTSGQVRVKVHYTPQQWLIVDVIDTGPGIDPKHQEAIFERFKQIDNAADRVYGGSGLGLPISRAFARVLGGDLSLISSSLGTTFTLALPATATKVTLDPASAPFNTPVDLEVVSDDDSLLPLIEPTLRSLDLDNVQLTANNPKQQASILPVTLRQSIRFVLTPDTDIVASHNVIATIYYRPEEPKQLLNSNHTVINDIALLYPAIIWSLCYWHTSSTPIEGGLLDTSALATLRLLLAEDNLVNQAVIHGLLSKVGASVEIANNGEEALSCVLASKYDVLLVDMQMPVMSGLDFIQHYQQVIPEPQQIPIIVLTADTAAASSADAAALGVYKVIAKPLDPAVLIESIQAASGLVMPKHDPSDESPIDKQYFQSVLHSLEDTRQAERIVAIFQSTVGELLEELCDAVARDDYNGGRQVIHSLMSATSTIGARSMHQHLTRLHDLQPSESGWAPAAVHEHQILKILFPATVDALKDQLQSNVIPIG